MKKEFNEYSIDAVFVDKLGNGYDTGWHVGRTASSVLWMRFQQWVLCRRAASDNQWFGIQSNGCIRTTTCTFIRRDIDLSVTTTSFLFYRWNISIVILVSATSNNEACAFPFQPELDGSSGQTVWSMSFCYKNQCPTSSGTLATCTSGNYGLVSLDAAETDRTISDTLKSQVITRDARGEQCLRFYYYFTVYEQQDWGQQIEVLIHPDTDIDQPISIDKRSFPNMEENKWNFREVTFNSTSKNYSVSVLWCEASNAVRMWSYS